MSAQTLVIGATGFIGLGVVDALLENGHQVRITRRPQTATVLLKKRPVEKVEASLESYDDLVTAMRGCDTVFLTGAYYPRYSTDLQASIDKGVQGVKNACEAAITTGVKRFIYTSSIATLGPSKTGTADENDLLPQCPTDSVYRATKWEMERAISGYASKGLDIVSLLPGGCVGPGDIRVGSSGFMVGIVKGLMPWWVNGTVNLVDVRDVAKAHVAAINARQTRYCLAGHTVTTDWLFHYVANTYGGVMPAELLSADQAKQRADQEEKAAVANKARVPIPREMVDIALCGQKVSDQLASRELGFAPRPLETSLRETYEWFQRFSILPKSALLNTSERTSHEHL